MKIDKGNITWYGSKEGCRGHPDFYKYLEAMATLHDSKNAEYTQGGDPLGNFKRVSAILAIWGYDIPPWLVAAIYALKQQDCSMTMLKHGVEGKIESVDARISDESVYTVLKRILVAEKQAL